jgi:hypothetical protein
MATALAWGFCLSIVWKQPLKRMSGADVRGAGVDELMDMLRDERATAARFD